MGETIVPSWQDAAERWKSAYGESQARLRLLEARFEALRGIWLEKNVGANGFYVNGLEDRLAQLADLYDEDIAENTRALLDPQ